MFQKYNRDPWLFIRKQMQDRQDNWCSVDSVDHLLVSWSISSCLFLSLPPFPPPNPPAICASHRFVTSVDSVERGSDHAGNHHMFLAGFKLQRLKKHEKTIKQPPGIFLVCFYKMCYLINLFLRFCKTVDCKKDDSAMSVMMHLDLRFKQNDNEI